MAVELEVEIEKGVYRGLGLARPEGRVIFVPRAFPGDRLRVRLEREGGRHAEARLLEVLKAGPGRRAAPCPHAAACGGCAYQELGDAEQLELKRVIVRESLERAGLAVGHLPIRCGPLRAGACAPACISTTTGSRASASGRATGWCP